MHRMPELVPTQSKVENTKKLVGVYLGVSIYLSCNTLRSEANNAHISLVFVISFLTALCLLGEAVSFVYSKSSQRLWGRQGYTTLR